MREAGAAQAIVVLFGLVAGSFVSVCAHRLPRGRSVVRPGSRCPGCEHRVAGWENVPVLGYLMLGGRCRGCGRGIGWRYLLLELGCGAGFWWSWERAGAGVDFVQGAFFLACLAGLAATDLECRQLPDEITLGGWAVGVGLAGWAGAPGLAAALVASVGGAGLLALVGLGYQRLRGREGLGWGDVKMVGLLGAFLGIEGTLAAVLLASVGGAAVGIGQALGVAVERRRRGRSWRQARTSASVYLARGALPLGVFLSAAAAAVWAAGPRVWRGWLG